MHELASGGTAVGTGLNAPDGFGAAIAAKLTELTGLPLATAASKFAAQDSLDAMVATSAGLRGVAVTMRPIVVNNILHTARTLREAVLALGVSAAGFERIVDPHAMVGHPRQDLGLRGSG
ncbi:lyase family protein [Pseudonocardia acidicola]|uniref:lyase family protein n=1 Tax=Pseudonocardia acidicola TaxID=2724939 RepID=UPI0023B27E9D|nr:lyase family protein [Pseudonocardia acidicola]